MVGSCPLDCPDTCAWHVTVDDTGQAVKIRGDPGHPFTRGGLCPKVNPWLRMAADPSRLTQPMRRVGGKGEGRFRPVTWDEALTEMAERLHTVIETSGGAAVWPFHGTGNLGWLQGTNGPHRIWTRMGASAHHMSICSVAGRHGINYAVGTGDWLDAESFAQAGLVLIWGSNTLVTNRHLWPFIEQARAAGAPLFVVDPIRTRTAEQADGHLAPAPGTDGALALGLSRVIVDRGGADEHFLANRTVGWVNFEARLAFWDLQRTSEVTGVPAARIEELAEAIIEAPPLAVRIGHGIQRHAAGGAAMRTVACLPAVVGAYDQPGGGSLYSSSGTPKGYNLERSRRPGLGNRPRTLTMTNLGRNLTELSDPPVEALIVYGANPMVSNPETDLVRRGLERSDLFTVVIELYPTETSAYADLVLPSTMQHEHAEINDSYNHRYLHWNEPAVAAPGSCLPHTEIFRRLASAMGYDDAELFASDEELAADLLDSPELVDAGVTLERLRSTGFLPLPPRAEPDRRPFPTPSGRFEFTSQRAEDDGHELVAGYRPPAEAADAATSASGPRAGPSAPLALIAAASDHHVNSTFAGTDVVRTANDDPPLILHPTDAATRALGPGDVAWVANERGGFSAVVVVSDRTRVGVAATTKGWWHHRLNATVAERDADMGHGAVFHDNAVTVERLA